MYLVYDLETSGLPNGRDKHFTETEAFDTCRIMSIALVLIDDDHEIAEEYYAVVKPDEKFAVSKIAQDLHGISWEDAHENGVELSVVMKKMKRMLKRCDGLVAHNLFGFDYPVLMSELYRRDMLSMLKRVRRVDKLCTMRIARQLFGKGYMKLSAVYANLFQGKEMENAHNALDDAVHCAEIFIAMHLKGSGVVDTDECKPGCKRSYRSIAN
jgi:DNA polymerase III epsilon subunit-like protein